MKSVQVLHDCFEDIKEVGHPVDASTFGMATESAFIVPFNEAIE